MLENHCMGKVGKCIIYVYVHNDPVNMDGPGW